VTAAPWIPRSGEVQRPGCDEAPPETYVNSAFAFAELVSAGC
jgi:hypothetical protein